MKYLSAKEILLVHALAISETGGGNGVRDPHAIFTLQDLPRQSAFSKELYPGVYKKAALYARNIILSHPFVDGNKRTAMTSAIVFMEDNGYHFVAKEGQVEKFALKIVNKHLEINAIAKWFKENSMKQ